MKLKCLIVDDEPLACDVLESHIAKVPSLNLAAKCSNAMVANEILHEQEIDLLFLDIEMPEITGLDFVRSLKNP
ncbi:MAG TPA: response regulator, partial [Flavobacterium sp.]|nr:response regulator [Flavobacterium sp.]